MNKNDLRNPLIQSGIILLVVFLLIAIVAQAPAEGFVGSVAAIVSAFLYGLLFIVALTIAIIFSIAVIIGLFLAAVSIHSVDKARSMFYQLIEAIKAFAGKIPPFKPHRLLPSSKRSPSGTARSETTSTGTGLGRSNEEAAEPQGRMDQMVTEMQHIYQSMKDQVNNLQHRISSMQENGKDSERLSGLEQSHQKLADGYLELSAGIQAVTDKLHYLELRMDREFDALRSELEELVAKVSLPEPVAGILSYIDLPEEREMVIAKAEEAVSRGMTYAQIDEFFKVNLPSGVYAALADHPRLTKDFLRSVKKRFE